MTVGSAFVATEEIVAVIEDCTPICDGYTMMTPPPLAIGYSGKIFMVYLAFCPAPVVFALNSAFFIVFGVFIKTVTGFASVFNEDTMPSWASVIKTSKEDERLVVWGFWIPLMVRRKGCKGLMPRRGDLIVNCNLIELSMKA